MESNALYDEMVTDLHTRILHVASRKLIVFVRVFHIVFLEA